MDGMGNVKIQIDLTKPRLRQVWVGVDPQNDTI